MRLIASSGAERFVIRSRNVENEEIEERFSTTNTYVLNGLISGTWYELNVFSIGVNERRNLRGSDIIRKQTGNFVLMQQASDQDILPYVCVCITQVQKIWISNISVLNQFFNNVAHGKFNTDIHNDNDRNL